MDVRRRFTLSIRVKNHNVFFIGTDGFRIYRNTSECGWVVKTEIDSQNSRPIRWDQIWLNHQFFFRYREDEARPDTGSAVLAHLALVRAVGRQDLRHGSFGQMAWVGCL